jgi:hypothetical protein
MLSKEQLDEVERIIKETPVEREWVGYPEDNVEKTLESAARRVREYLTPLNQGDGT